jgi:hypothetical protein
MSGVETPAHPGLAAGRWHTMSLVEQLGNAGSEVNRALNAFTEERTPRWERAFARALELLDLSAADPRWSVARRREILRARELFCRVFFDTSAEPDLGAYLQKYFLQFAIAARRPGQPGSAPVDLDAPTAGGQRHP